LLKGIYDALSITKKQYNYYNIDII